MRLSIPDGLIPGLKKPGFEVRDWESITYPEDCRDSSDMTICEWKGLIFRNNVVCEPWTVTIRPFTEILVEQESLVVEDGVLYCVFPFREYTGNRAELVLGLCRIGMEETADKVLKGFADGGEQFPVTQSMIEESLKGGAGEGPVAFLRLLNRYHTISEEMARALLPRIPDLQIDERITKSVKMELIRVIRSDTEVRALW